MAGQIAHLYPAANVIAEEKTIHVKQQRPTIRALGKPKLKKLILQIFEANRLKATFSRFAGSRWRQSESGVPDLWRNTAQVLKDHPIFRQVAQEMGLWDQVITTVKKCTFHKGKRKTNE